MRAALPTTRALLRGLTVLGAIVVVFGGKAEAQTASTSDSGWQRYDWLSSAQNPQNQSTATGTTTVSVGQDVKDPTTVLSTGSLWQQKVDTLYTRRVADSLLLSYESSTTMLAEASNPALPLAGGTPDDLTRGQKVALQFQPISDLTLNSNLHESSTDAAIPGDAVVTTGAGFSAEGHLPLNSVLSLGVNSDRTATDASSNSTSTDTTYDAQIKQPLGNLPLSAILKGHLEETQTPGSPVGRAPSLEQSLSWKPMEDTTVQMGLRQQQYQEYPGIDDQFNEALFADWSQKIIGDVSWHSYAELLNSRSLVDQAPASPLASGSNGTAQASVPTSNASLSSALPLSMQDQTVTFSTGPSFLLHKDISASVEYSNRWDKNPAPGSVGQEQRVSVSLKGSF